MQFATDPRTRSGLVASCTPYPKIATNPKGGCGFGAFRRSMVACRARRYAGEAIRTSSESLLACSRTSADDQPLDLLVPSKIVYSFASRYHFSTGKSLM